MMSAGATQLMMAEHEVTAVLPSPCLSIRAQQEDPTIHVAAPLTSELNHITTPFGWKFPEKEWLAHPFSILRENISLIFRGEHYVPHVKILYKS